MTWAPMALLIPWLAAMAQDFSGIRIDKVAEGYRFTDGPAWSPDGFLLFSDAANNTIWKFTPGVRPQPFRENARGANGNAFDRQGRLYTCETEARRVTRTDRRGQVEVLAERWEGKRLNGPNDIVVRRDGHVYFTDPAFGAELDTRELDFYGVYHLTPKGELALVARPVGRPNGIALSPDGRLLYVANSDEHNVRAYDIDGKGEASGERVLISAIQGVPHGLRVDEKGNLYIAADGLLVYNPAGRRITRVELSEAPANCAFGDPDLKTLYITARTSIYRIRLDVKGASQH